MQATAAPATMFRKELGERLRSPARRSTGWNDIMQAQEAKDEYW